MYDGNGCLIIIRNIPKEQERDFNLLSWLPNLGCEKVAYMHIKEEIQGSSLHLGGKKVSLEIIVESISYFI